MPAPDPICALEAFREQAAVLLLESALRRGPMGRYSFLTADPFDFVELQRARFGCDPFGAIRERLARLPASTAADLPPFQGGAAGLLSYELGGAWEHSARARHDEFQLPDMSVGLYDWVIAWDHVNARAWVISHGFPETDRVKRTDRAGRRLQWVRRTLQEFANATTAASARSRRPASASPLRVGQLAPQWPAPGASRLTSDFSREGYLQTVKRVVELIHAGEIFQANLSQRLLHPLIDDAFELYRRLRGCNSAPFAGYFATGDWAVASASPERFVSLRDGQVETRPIKGTRQRRTVPEADLFTRDELRESRKDQAENVMIVDLLRNDLSRVCAPGSLQVPNLCTVETYETVQHLVSEVRGTLTHGRDGLDLMRAVFPGGSITGAPKVRAMEVIAAMEPTARGPYCGSLFYLGFDGRMDSSILIRTFICRRGWIQCRVGGGVVAQSSPVAEYEETLHKAEGMLRALESV